MAPRRIEDAVESGLVNAVQEACKTALTRGFPHRPADAVPPERRPGASLRHVASPRCGPKLEARPGQYTSGRDR